MSNKGPSGNPNKPPKEFGPDKARRIFYEKTGHLENLQKEFVAKKDAGILTPEALQTEATKLRGELVAYEKELNRVEKGREGKVPDDLTPMLLAAKASVADLYDTVNQIAIAARPPRVSPTKGKKAKKSGGKKSPQPSTAQLPEPSIGPVPTATQKPRYKFVDGKWVELSQASPPVAQDPSVVQRGEEKLEQDAFERFAGEGGVSQAVAAQAADAERTLAEEKKHLANLLEAISEVGRHSAAADKEFFDPSLSSRKSVDEAIATTFAQPAAPAQPETRPQSFEDRVAQFEQGAANFDLQDTYDFGKRLWHELDAEKWDISQQKGPPNLRELQKLETLLDRVYDVWNRAHQALQKESSKPPSSPPSTPPQAPHTPPSSVLPQAPPPMPPQAPPVPPAAPPSSQAPPVLELSEEQDARMPTPDAIQQAKREAEQMSIRENFAQMQAETKGLGKEREELLAAEKQYLDSKYDFEEKNKFTTHLVKSLFRSKEAKGVKEAGERYNERAAEFAKLMAEREGVSTKEKSKAYWRTMGIISRVEERVMFAHERALNERGRDALEKIGVWVAEKNQSFENKVGKNKARAIRILASATLGSLVGAAAAPASVLTGFAGFGARVVRSVVGVAGGAAAGATLGVLAGARAREKRASAETTKALSAKEIAKNRRAYRGGSESAVAAQRRKIEMITALLTGAGFSFSTAEVLAQSPVVQHAAEPLVATPGPEPAIPAEAATESPSATASESAPEAQASASAGEPTAPAQEFSEFKRTPEEISAESAPGKGYEFMLKSLHDQLSKEGYTAGDFKEGTDAHRLLSAPAGKVDTVVHQIASDERHGFFDSKTGESVRIELDSKLRLGTDGQLHLTTPRYEDVVRAPEGAPTTPQYPQPAPQPQLPAETAPQKFEYGFSDDRLNADIAANPPPVPSAENIPSSELSTEEMPPEALEKAPQTPEGVLVEPTPVSETTLAEQTSSSVAVQESSTAPVHLNSHGVEVDPEKTNLYQDVNGVKITYGGTLAERFKLAQEIALKNHEPVFFDSTPETFLSKIFPRHQLTQVFWDQNSESVQMRVITRGVNMPVPDDLYPIKESS